ncbi:YciI family protein [Nonomuraea cavernae]|uniref:YCII-related domain-containing protein n=1 Tax=Nonomuraea cavernae TaxID=2045107 RepID=A0A918DJ60_9ACTN|nr:YciI family protein [Nonomuraea cavernae]MCA2186892.1 YciI family protein [Nonomuraea cavernae]GGO67273.1 hypothetical protein GCM10012289_23300 [Nonomuraea cavernae]
MRFLMTTKANGAAAPDEAVYAEMAKLVEEMTQAGVLLATGGLDPVGVHVTATDGTMTVTDGPFAEAKEAIVSFALIEARSQEEAIELSRRFWKVVGSGEGNIQQVFGPED